MSCLYHAVRHLGRLARRLSKGIEALAMAASLGDVERQHRRVFVYCHVDLPFRHLDPPGIRVRPLASAFSHVIRAIAGKLRIRVKRTSPKARTTHFFVRAEGSKSPSR